MQRRGKGWAGFRRYAAVNVGQLLCLGLLAAGALIWLSAGVAEGATCPNDHVRALQVVALKLPDCRAYEQVSPTAKNFTDALGNYQAVQSPPNGEGGLTYFSISPFPVSLGAGDIVTYLSTRAGDSWRTQSLLPPSNGKPEQTVAMSDDLGSAIVSSFEPLLAPGAIAGEYNTYLHDSTSGAYRLLMAGEEAPGVAGESSDDSKVFFEYADGPLAPEAAEGNNVYEWDNGTVRVASILPEGEGGAAVTGGTFAGSGPSLEGFYAENAVSEDGSRIFFTDVETGKLYARANHTTTYLLSSGAATFLSATPMGEYVFFSEAGQLLRRRLGPGGEPGAPEAVTPSGAEVEGMLGAGVDGQSIYFVARAALSVGTGPTGETAEVGAFNLYQWKAGQLEPSFIIRLQRNASEGEDESDWRSKANYNTAEPKTARIDAAGSALVFTSIRQLTPYDNNGQSELYRFQASPARLTCVSCDPLTAEASTGAVLNVTRNKTAGPTVRNPFLTRNLSRAGTRVFFNTAEALVPMDTNGQLDVYEWEQEGSGECTAESPTFDESSSGCLYLISTGRSSSESVFGDADEEGTNVYFFTRESLVRQDEDGNNDAYDARVDGGIEAQNPGLPSEPCVADACRGAFDQGPAAATPSSATLSGVGDLTPPPPTASTSHRAVTKLTRAQQLARALKRCRAKRKTRRVSCERQARKTFGTRRPAPNRQNAAKRAHAR